MARDKGVLTRETHTAAAAKFDLGDSSEPVTKKAEQQARDTGKLNPLVDPSGFGTIRRSLPRLEKIKRGKNKGLWELLVGPPMAIETRVDTTSSMGDNVDIAFRVLPTLWESCGVVLPGYDPQYATGCFNDISDRWILCRPQFEMEAEKIVEQMSLMVPVRGGGDSPEDPHYGLFGGAFLTAAHIVKLGLKTYDFTVSDAPARDRLDERQLIRVYGDDVFDKVAENGHQVDRNDLPSTKEVVDELLLRSHAFFLQVGHSSETTRFWGRVFPKDRCIVIPGTEVLPQVQAAIIGLTQGTLDLGNTEQFLRDRQVSASMATQILRAVAGIPIGAQAALPNFAKLPKKGDLFAQKTDLWPVDTEVAVDVDADDESGDEEGDDSVGWE